jgi:hypothetical protein
MNATLPPDLSALIDRLSELEGEARALASGLNEKQGASQPAPGSWSIAECLDHLAVTNAVYLEAMRPAALRASDQQRLRRGPALPGVFGRLFVKSLEPPVRSFLRTKAPPSVRPKVGCTASDALAGFISAQADVAGFVRRYAHIDLAGTRFQNPFVSGLRLSLATGLHAIVAHERRHLWQCRQIRGRLF